MKTLVALGFIIFLCVEILTAQSRGDTVITIIKRPANIVVCSSDSLHKAQLAAVIANLKHQDRSDRNLRRVTAVASVLTLAGVAILVFRNKGNNSHSKEYDHDDWGEERKSP